MTLERPVRLQIPRLCKGWEQWSGRASPQDQAKREAFVLAPRYVAPIVDDNSDATNYLDMTVDLVNLLTTQYSIDTMRLYTTGQSGGAMTSIAIDIKYPDLFAASFLVAGQWDPTKVQPLAQDKLWIVVSEGDLKAYPRPERYHRRSGGGRGQSQPRGLEWSIDTQRIRGCVRADGG
jgi:hypothetical protein